MYKNIILSISLISLLTSCSSKKYFEPEDTKSYNNSSKDLPAKIWTFNKNFATLENGQYISTEGISKAVLPENFELLNIKDNIAVAANKKKKVFIDGNYIELENNVVAATLRDNLLSVIFSNNTLAIYDINEKKYIFKEYQKESFVNDTRITNPIFLSNIVLFPTLDGKIVVVSLESLKIVRNIVVDTNDKFNNIVFFELLNDTLIAATDNKVIAVASDSLNVKDYEIRDIVNDDKYVYIATIDGMIIKLDDKLNEVKSNKFKYAKIHSLFISNDNIYAVESQGYLIKLDKDFNQQTIYDISFNKEEKSFSIGKIIANKDNYFQID